MGNKTLHKKGYTCNSRPSGRQTQPSNNGDYGSQDPQAGGHTIQEAVQRESRRGTMGVKTLEKADTPSKKGYKGSQEGVQWESRPSRRRTHHPRRGTKGVKKVYKGIQDPQEGGHTKADTLRKHEEPLTVQCLGKI